jgi:hypothetical protein
VGAVQVVAVLEAADTAFAPGSPFDQAAQSGLSFMRLAGSAGSALAGDGHRFPAGVVQAGLDTGFAVATSAATACAGWAGARLIRSIAVDHRCQPHTGQWFQVHGSDGRFTSVPHQCLDHRERIAADLT